MRKRKSIIISPEIHDIAKKIRQEHGISIQHFVQEAIFFYAKEFSKITKTKIKE